MDFSNIIRENTDDNLAEMIGRFIMLSRLSQNKTQQQIADEAGINRSTIVQLENGGGATLGSFIQVLRVLDQLQVLSVFNVKQEISPIQLAKLQLKSRKRASGGNKLDDSKSDW